jgi:hypothetical protein
MYLGITLVYIHSNFFLEYARALHIIKKVEFLKLQAVLPPANKTLALHFEVNNPWAIT